MLSTRPHPRPSRQNMTHIQPGEEMTPISQSEASVGWPLTNQRPPLSLSLSRLTNKSRSWVKTQLTDLGVQGSLDFTILSSLISAPLLNKHRSQSENTELKIYFLDINSDLHLIRYSSFSRDSIKRLQRLRWQISRHYKDTETQTQVSEVPTWS